MLKRCEEVKPFLSSRGPVAQTLLKQFRCAKVAGFFKVNFNSCCWRAESLKALVLPCEDANLVGFARIHCILCWFESFL